MEKFISTTISGEDVSNTYDDDHQYMAFKGAWDALEVEVKEVKDSVVNLIPMFEVKVKKAGKATHGWGSYFSTAAKKELEAHFGDEIDIRFMK